MAAVNCSSSRELSCRDATSFSASWEPRERGKAQLPNHSNSKMGLGLRSSWGELDTVGQMGKSLYPGTDRMTMAFCPPVEENP